MPKNSIATALRPRLFLFDLDGTLADTAPGLHGALADICLAAKVTPPSLAQVRPWCSAGARGLLQLGLDLAPHDAAFGAARTEFLHAYQRHMISGSAPFPHIATMLAAITDQNLRWGIVTNKPTVYTLPILSRLGWLMRTACVTCGDSTPHPKPAPDALLLACRVAGMEPGCTVYIGDDRRDIEAGRAAGMVTAVAAWGYLGTDSPPLHQWGADHILNSPDDWVLLNS